jgi:hypothetical protein
MTLGAAASLCSLYLIFLRAKIMIKKARSRHPRERGPDLTPLPPSPWEVGANFYRKFYSFSTPVRRHRCKTFVMLQNSHFAACCRGLPDPTIGWLRPYRFASTPAAFC